MSTVDIYGTLILDGELTCDQEITVRTGGKIIPVPSEDYARGFFDCPTKAMKFTNGKGRNITSIESGITVEAGGEIDGEGHGYEPNLGPGANSTLLNNLNQEIEGYGATHAGLGFVRPEQPGFQGMIVDEITITRPMGEARKLPLSGIPDDETNVVLNIVGGTSQYYLGDFYFEFGNILTWVGTPLENLLNEGDEIRVIYMGSTYETVPPPKPSYGSYQAPTSLGSGSMWTAGGGAVKLIARSGVVLIDGLVNMNGQSGETGIETGGGSAGSVWVTAWDIAGSGAITTNGGSTQYVWGGGGGGGYISLWYECQNAFSGILSVLGMDGGTDGLTYEQRFKPILEEKFTGDILNTKWWQIAEDPVVLDNYVLMDSTQNDFRQPALESVFTLSGRNITADVDYIALGSEVSSYSANFLLYKDFQNWVGIGKRNGHLFGIYSLGGLNSQFGIPADYSSATFRILKTDSTFTFQHYDCTNIPETIHTEIIDEFANERFKVRLELEKSNTDPTIDYFQLTGTDIANQYVTLSDPPIDGSAVALSVLQGTHQYYGTDFYVSGQQLLWDQSSAAPFRALLAPGDDIRVIYATDMSQNAVMAGWDNLRLYDGIVYNHQSNESTVYVDSSRGSDASDGRQLSPLQNLFVATTWARPGATIVLYDGTYNPTEVICKDLTIRGANGANALVTSAYSQDTTGSGWETNAISFKNTQGRIHNLNIRDSEVGVYGEDTKNLTVYECDIGDTSTAVKIGHFSTEPVIRSTNLHDSSVGADFSSTIAPYVYSCSVYDNECGVVGSDSTDMVVSSSTLDNNITDIIYDSSSSGWVSSNNLTNSSVGLYISSDSSQVSSVYNNFWGTPTPYAGRAPDFTSNNISANPAYSNILARDYHLTLGSPDVNAGSGEYDHYYMDAERKNRSLLPGVDIGSYELLDGTHDGTGWYVSTTGDDYVNFGRQGDPFRTLDRAMDLADAVIEVDGAHYDSFYLSLRSENVYLNQFSTFTRAFDWFVSYITITPSDVDSSSAYLPGYNSVRDGTNIALNPLTGSAQYFGTDFSTSYDNIVWGGLGMDGIVSAGDVLRVIHPFQANNLNFMTLRSHYSDVDISNLVFVSPSGSDSTIVTGDGTYGWGNGSYENPWRTVDKALEESTDGANLVVLPGEYSMFSAGRDDRVILPYADRTSHTDKVPRKYVYDLFAPDDFRSYNHVEHDQSLWDFTASPDSSVSVGSGYLDMSYDSTHEARANSVFTMTGDFEISADMRNASHPFEMSVQSLDCTAYAKYIDGTVVGGAGNSEHMKYCWSEVSVPEQHRYFTEYLCLSANDINRGHASLSYVAHDCTGVILNLVGGSAQEQGVDYEVLGEKIVWHGYDMDGQLEPGDQLRAIYYARGLSDQIHVKIARRDDILSIRAYNYTDWYTIAKKVVPTDGTWSVSFSMNEAVDMTCQTGRGLASKFLAVAEDIQGVPALEYLAKTERKVALFYGDRS